MGRPLTLLIPAFALVTLVESIALVNSAITPDQAKQLHALFDQDGNGKVSIVEITTFWATTRHSIGKKNAPEVISDLDANKDGKVSLGEILTDKVWESFEPGSQQLNDQQASEKKKFTLVDKNGDGKLDGEEIIPLFFPDTDDGVMELVAERFLEMHDADGDGKISNAEFPDKEADFARLDADHDGKLDGHEVKAWESGQFNVEEAMRKLFESADANSDGYLSAPELVDARAVRTSSDEKTDASLHLRDWAEHHEL